MKKRKPPCHSHYLPYYKMPYKMKRFTKIELSSVEDASKAVGYPMLKQNGWSTCSLKNNLQSD